MKCKMNSKAAKSLCVLLALLSVVLFSLLSPFADCDSLKLKAVGILIAALILWISNALPMSISTLLMIFFLPILGLMEYDEAISSFGTGTALFIMASSGITVAVFGSNIPHKIIELVFNKMGRHPVGLIYAFGICVTLFSGFVSSLATCVLFTALVTGALKNMGLEKGRSNFAKAMTISVPACAGIGGFISPAGIPANLLVMDILKEKGTELSFGRWFAIGFPVGLLASLVFLTFLVLILRPEKKSKNGKAKLYHL